MPNRPRILVVDDDPDISLALADYLQQEQFEIDVAATGTLALKKGLANHYDAVLLDVGLPDLDGIEVLAELSRLKPELPVILLTAYTSLSQAHTTSILKKAFTLLIKPYSREEILHALRQAVLETKNSQWEKDTPSHKEATQRLCRSFVEQSLNPKPGNTHPNSQLSLNEYQQLADYIQIMQFAFDHVPEAVLVADANKRFRFANQSAYQILGYSKEELEGLCISDIAPNHDTERYYDHLNQLREGKSLSYYTTHRTKLGQNIPVEISVYLLNFHGQEYTCAITKQMPDQSITVETGHLHTGLSS